MSVGAISIFALAVAMPSTAEEHRVTQLAGVDNTAMGPYRALAQLAFQAFQKKDMAAAAELSRILERTWDAAEETGGPTSLGVKNKQLFEQIDKAMDAFIKPVLHYATKAPDPVAVNKAYNDFLGNLKQGDEPEK